MTPSTISGRWWPCVAWTVVILVITSVPGTAIPHGPQIPGADKVVHGSMYGVLGFLAGKALGRDGFARWVVAGVLIAALAAGDEWHQQWIPARSAETLDWVADVAGATLGMTLSRSAQARRESRS
ncbi:MAG: VanZ family protein [Gemmatimonadaceae bacterium]|nr:VanZ family protein [Gemmatimonadaceae bacterium]